MKTGHKYSTEFLIFLLTSALVMVYLIIRAVYVPFTHDEASTFFRYVQPEKLIPGITREDANNHFLNTVLTWVSWKIFGPAKWALRLPNLLFAPVYFYFVYRTGMLLKDKILRYGFWGTLLFALYFIEFFAVSRGYGMSIALFMGALYFLMRAAETQRPAYHFYVSLFVLLMLSANLNLVIPALALFGYQFILIGINYPEIHKKQWLWVMAFVAIYLIAFYFSLGHLLQLRANNGLYIGGNKDFIHATLFTLTWLLTGKSMIAGVIVMLVYFAFILVVNIRKLIPFQRQLFGSPGFAVSVILVASVAGILLAALLFKVHYPEDRLAMYLFPLLMVSLFFTLDEFRVNDYPKSPVSRHDAALAAPWREKIPALPVFIRIILLLPLLFFPVHFFARMNILYVNGYRNEAIPRRFYDHVHKAHIEDGFLPTIGGSNMRQFAWMYIDFINGGQENMVDWKAFPDTVSDFQILEKNSYPFSLSNYQPVDSAPAPGLYLYERKKRVGLLPTKLRSFSQKTFKTGKKYKNLLEITSDTISGKYFFFDFRMSISSEKDPFYAWLVIQVSDREKNTLVYKYIPFDWLKYHYDGVKDNFHQSMFVGPLPGNAHQLKIYIWNKAKMKYELKGYEIEVFEVSDK